MINIYLKELIEKGHFGPIYLGMHRAQIESLIGLPDELGGTSRKYHQSAIWKYGIVELHFDRNSDLLNLIYIDDFDRTDQQPSSLSSICIDHWILNKSLTIDQAVKHLSNIGIAHQIADYQWEENYKCIVTGNCMLIFDKQRHLCVVSVSAFK
jgi:hypothetical protein